MSTKKLAQLIGKVFLQSSTLNLLSTVMDTPEFFWSAPDQLQVKHGAAYKLLADPWVSSLHCKYRFASKPFN